MNKLIQPLQKHYGGIKVLNYSGIYIFGGYL